MMEKDIPRNKNKKKGEKQGWTWSSSDRVDAKIKDEKKSWSQDNNGGP